MSKKKMLIGKRIGAIALSLFFVFCNIPGMEIAYAEDDSLVVDAAEESEQVQEESEQVQEELEQVQEEPEIETEEPAVSEPEETTVTETDDTETAAEEVDKSSYTEDTVKVNDKQDIKGEDAAIKVAEDESAGTYLNPYSGNDDNDGSKSSPVKTFDKAKELAEKNSEDKTIYLMGTLSASGEMSLTDGVVLKRGPGFTGTMITVGSGKTLTLSNITIDGDETQTSSGPLINVGGTLDMNSGVVLKNNNNGSNSGFGGALSVSGTFNMNGGTIENNYAGEDGGGLYVSGIFNMYGGTIENNRADDGGGVGIGSGGVMNFYNGSVIYNHAYVIGGGISVGGGNVYTSNPKLYMYGGNVSNNTSARGGGGIYIQAGCYGYIEAGTISNNVGAYGNIDYMGWYIGGGIYVNGGYEGYNGTKDGRLDLKKTYISGNVSKEQGGGIANCPTSNLSAYISNGIAIGNNYQRYRVAAVQDDFFATSIPAGSNGVVNHRGNPTIYLSSIMLGGAKNNWKLMSDDTSIDYVDQYYTLPDYTNVGLYNDISDEDLERAASKATVFITDNYARSGKGGGIGSNGIVNVGVEHPALGGLSVTKVATGDDDFKNREFEIKVTLDYKISGKYGDMEFIDGVAEFTIKDGETKTAEDLMVDIEYTVEEKAGEDYKISYTGERGVIQENTTQGVTVTNTQNPEEPEIPETPGDEPEEPEEPEIPETPGDEPEEPKPPVDIPNTGDTPKPEVKTPPVVKENPPVVKTQTTTVKTGDETNIALWVGLAVFAGALIYVLTTKTWKKK